MGRTDRVPLSPRLRPRFETNIGLAQSRAEGIKEAILKFCGERGLDTPTLLTEVAGPRHTPEAAPRPAPESLAYGGDRSVEISSFQTDLVKVDTAAQQRQQSRGAWWGFAGLGVILLLAVCMALGTTKWSASLDLASGKAHLEGERKSAPDRNKDA